MSFQIFDGQAIFKAAISIVINHPFNYYIFINYYSEDGTSSPLVSGYRFSITLRYSVTHDEASYVSMVIVLPL